MYQGWKNKIESLLLFFCFIWNKTVTYVGKYARISLNRRKNRKNVRTTCAFGARTIVIAKNAPPSGNGPCPASVGPLCTSVTNAPATVTMSIQKSKTLQIQRQKKREEKTTKQPNNKRPFCVFLLLSFCRKTVDL